MMEVVKDPGNDQNQFFVDLVNEYQGMLLHMCYVYLRDQEMAKDAVQETFLKAYRGLNTFRGESNVKTWLIQIWKGQYGICTGCEDDPLLRQQQRSIVIFVLLSALRRKTSDEASSYTRAKAVTGMGYHTAAVGCNQTKKNHCPMPPLMLY